MGGAWNESVAGRVCVVTGASRGIGRATAELLAECGMRLLLTARSPGELEEVVQACRRHGASAYAQACDVTCPDEVAELARRAQELFGRVEVLVNNAGVGRYAPLEGLTDPEIEAMVAVTLLGTIRVTRALLPLLRRSGSGQVVNVSSIRGLETIPGTTVYAASKFGLMGFSQALAQELRAEGIRVSVVCPGGVRTDFGGVPAQTKPEQWLSARDVAQTILACLTTPPGVELSMVVVMPAGAG